jgi:hypothetical protein
VIITPRVQRFDMALADPQAGGDVPAGNDESRSGAPAMRLESGPAGYDRNYYSIFLLLCIGLGIWFYRDYAYKYPEKNVAEARKHLTLTGVGTLPDKFSETPTHPAVVH